MSQPYSDPAKIGSLPEPSHRRWWLLCKALESLPLDQAVNLARSAEEFVMGDHPSIGVAGTIRHPEAETGLPEQESEAIAKPPSRNPPDFEPLQRKPNGISLSTEKREELLERLAKGAKNSELAAQFGLSPHQVQGIRMGSAREIARRRERLGETKTHSPQPAADHETGGEECMTPVNRHPLFRKSSDSGSISERTSSGLE